MNQNNALLSIIGTSKIIFDKTGELKKLQKYTLNKFSKPLPPLEKEDAREYVSILNNRMEKLNKAFEDDLVLELTKNPDILKEISSIDCKAKIVGFCAESENLLENAKEKIQKKGCDYLVANDISRKDIGFSSDLNEVYILDKNMKISHIERDTKINIAKKILEKIFE